MSRYNPQPPQCAARRGDARCERPTRHDGPHRAECAADDGTQLMRWWFNPKQGWVAPLMSDPLVTIRR